MSIPKKKYTRTLTSNDSYVGKKQAAKILTPHCSASPNFAYSFNKAVPHHLFVMAFVVQTLC